VSVDILDGARLPYVDSLVNLLVAEDLGKVEMGEVLRVLAPLGVAYIKSGPSTSSTGSAGSPQAGSGQGQWTKTVKPWPADIDEWRQYLHDADNNAVARDT